MYDSVQAEHQSCQRVMWVGDPPQKKQKITGLLLAPESDTFQVIFQCVSRDLVRL